MAMFSKTSLRVTGIAVCALTLSFPVSWSAAEQQTSSSGAFRESASVTIVEIPVSVIGKDGKPVAGLTAADFELLDDGKKQPINGVDVVDLARLAAAPSGANAA